MWANTPRPINTSSSISGNHVKSRTSDTPRAPAGDPSRRLDRPVLPWIKPAGDAMATHCRGLLAESRRSDMGGEALPQWSPGGGPLEVESVRKDAREQSLRHHVVGCRQGIEGRLDRCHDQTLRMWTVLIGETLLAGNGGCFCWCGPLRPLDWQGSAAMPARNRADRNQHQLAAPRTSAPGNIEHCRTVSLTRSRRYSLNTINVTTLREDHHFQTPRASLATRDLA